MLLHSQMGMMKIIQKYLISQVSYKPLKLKKKFCKIAELMPFSSIFMLLNFEKNQNIKYSEFTKRHFRKINSLMNIS